MDLLVPVLVARAGLAFEVQAQHRLRLAPSAAPSLAPRDATREATGVGLRPCPDLDDFAGVAREGAAPARVPAAHALRIGAWLAGRKVDHELDLVPRRDAAAARALAPDEPDGAVSRGAFRDRPVEADPKGGQPLDTEHRVAAVCAPGDARVLHRDRAQLPPGSERRRRSARLGVAPCEIVEDAADHPPAEARCVEAVRCRVLAGLARN